MAKKIPAVEVEKVNKEVDIKPVEFNDKAFSIVPAGDKKYNVVSFKFNNETGETSDYKVEDKNLDIYEAKHSFQTKVVRAGLFSVRN